MDYVDPAKKRRHTRRLLVTYLLIAAVVAAGTLLLGLQSFGYHLDSKTGELVRDGLVFLSSQPGGADIYLNGERREQQTAARLVLPAGDYTVELKQEGYRSWQRDINLAGGTIERLVYPVLFPEQLQTADVQLYRSKPSLATHSPDRRWLLVLRPGSLTEFDLFDLNGERTSATTLTLPEGVLTASDQARKLTAAEWSSDNRRVLLKHTYGKQHEFIMLDRESLASSFNVNTLFNTNPSQVALRDKRFDRLYLYDAGAKTLRTGDVRARTSAPLLSRVLAFKPHEDDQLLYVTDQLSGPSKVNVNLLSGEESHTIKRLDSAPSYFLDLARFDGRWYIAAGSAKDNKVYVFENPLDELAARGFNPLEPVTVLNVKGAKELSFSANARFIALQGGPRFAVYDFETKRHHSYELETPIAENQRAIWMDGHRLSAISDGNTIVFDFNGINLQTLSPASAFQPFFNRDYTALHTIAPSPTVTTRPALLRTELEVE